MTRAKVALALIAAVGLLLGLLAPFIGLAWAQSWIWTAAAAGVLLALLVEIARSLRRGAFGLDIVAALSMGVALGFGESLAAAVVAVMYGGGQLLEDYAEARARAEMKALLARVPKRALRYAGAELEEVPIGLIGAGDRLLIRQGDSIPVDGTVLKGAALLDLSVLTGESVPVRRAVGEEVPSGAQSLDAAFDMLAAKTAAASTYSEIVRLVQQAQASKAPMVRLADRLSLWFLLFTVILAGGTYLVTGEERRMLAVLVSATPCPLILAVPVAVISGISRAAARGVLVKGGAILERLARARNLVIDKTGTLTHGRAELVDLVVTGRRRPDDVLRLAASLDQVSGHVVAGSIVAAARLRRLALDMPDAARETPGAGIEGRVGRQRVLVGSPRFVADKLRLRHVPLPEVPPGTLVSVVAVGRGVAGFLLLADTVRADASAMLLRLRQAGIARIVLASGDALPVVARVGAELGLDEIHGELRPQQKLEMVRRLRAEGPVIMAGDGVNDAPALAAADVGIAMGTHGAPASAEAADAVLLTDNLERIAEAVDIARRSRRIALQSVAVGLGLSVAAMVAAAFGYLQVVEGALLQEAIDVAVILNALRALR
jgi:heavy metal translocating P-type ATPase